MLGNGQHVLGNGPHLCTQFMNTGLQYSYYGDVRLGLWFILAPIVLGNGPHVLDNGPPVLDNVPHLCTKDMNWVILIMGRLPL